MQHDWLWALDLGLLDISNTKTLGVPLLSQRIEVTGPQCIARVPGVHSVRYIGGRFPECRWSMSE